LFAEGSFVADLFMNAMRRKHGAEFPANWRENPEQQHSSSSHALASAATYQAPFAVARGRGNARHIQFTPHSAPFGDIPNSRKVRAPDHDR
jgi:hypothetical protein